MEEMNHNDHQMMGHENHQMMGHEHHINHGVEQHVSYLGHKHSQDMDMNGSNLGAIFNTTGDTNDFDLNSGTKLLESHGAHGHGHSGHGSQHSMAMTFHGGYLETILFSWWKVTDVGEFVGSFIAIFIMALLYEGLKYYRKHLLWKTYAGLQYCAVSSPDKGVSNICSADDGQVIQSVPHVHERNIPTMLSTPHMWQTFLHGVQVLVSYMLMLVFMTYNTWLCAAVVLGSATGYFLFGWRESVVVDFTEHCH